MNAKIKHQSQTAKLFAFHELLSRDERDGSLAASGKQFLLPARNHLAVP